MQVCILGRQREISLAELKSRWGAESVLRLSDTSVKTKVDSINIDKFGGLLKVGDVLAENIAHNDSALIEACLRNLPPSSSKTTLGISWYDAGITPKQAFGFALSLKKQARTQKLKLRIVPNKTSALSSAQVLHNKLLEANNVELLIIQTGSNYLLARTTQIQDIEAYTKRDHGRPARDAKVGMLPPKLAQIMLNLAQVQPGQTVLDPFCGTGVVLQEALLLEASVCGSDLEPRMIDMTKTNLDWLEQTHGFKSDVINLEATDARIGDFSCDFDAVVSEIFLGPPLSHQPQDYRLKEIKTEIDSLLIDTLNNITRQSKPGTRLCLAVPAWQTKNGWSRLESVDSLEDFGYNRVSLKSAGNRPLIYARSGQVVARELVTLIRK